MLNQAINSTVNSPITISDFVVLIREKSSGEFGIHTADEKTQLNRLFAAIEKLALAAESEHLEANFSNGTLLSDRQNHITRLITNEFLFYTKVPLTLFEFDILRKKIESLAESLPSNLHLILSSFAVRTSEGKIMNVVLHVECGAHPQIRSIVKNNSSIIDPVYSENLNGSWVVLPYVKADTDRLPSGFSFDTFLISETEGKSKMVNCIEICFDHGLGVAKKKLDQMFYEKETISNELDESKKKRSFDEY